MFSWHPRLKNHAPLMCLQKCSAQQDPWPKQAKCIRLIGNAPRAQELRYPITQPICQVWLASHTRLKCLDISRAFFGCWGGHHRVHVMEDQLPDARYDTGLLPLRYAAFAQARDTQYGSTTAHFFDDVFSVHALSIDNSKRKEKKYLNLCLVFSCFNVGYGYLLDSPQKPATPD
ncbi:hypothetical protein ACFWQD_07980 [Alcaligenes faecalis]|uniref:hypothetical protein n=1 Tax=Alcaligenes faecalis TaxID=511 RepID=UPI0036688A3C